MLDSLHISYGSWLLNWPHEDVYRSTMPAPEGTKSAAFNRQSGSSYTPVRSQRPAEMTKSDEYKGPLFIYQEEKDFGFLIPRDDANTCFLPCVLRDMDMEEINLEIK